MKSIIFFTCFLLSVSFSSSVFAENDRTFFWQVKSETTTVFLLGSIHFADASFYPLRSEIINAYNESKNLVVELDVGAIDPEEYMRIMQSDGYYSNGTTIKDHLPKETFLQLEKVLLTLGVDYQLVKTQKPGMMVLTLTSLFAIKMKLDPLLGIDFYFLRKAKEGKDVVELETVKQQMEIFLSADNDELLLAETLSSFDDMDIYMDKMIRYWKQGDEGKMEKLIFDDAIEDYPVFAAIYEKLFYKRNELMTKKIEQMLKSKEINFVVVGAGHLIGDRSIVQLLRNKGYEIIRK